MKANTFLVTGTLILMLSLTASAMRVDYFYSPNCGHCQEISPFVKELSYKYNNVGFNFLDVTQGSYNVMGTPTLKINTNDKREITLVGSYDIPRYLECELNEMSTLDCPTTSYLNYTTNSYFIR